MLLLCCCLSRGLEVGVTSQISISRIANKHCCPVARCFRPPESAVMREEYDKASYRRVTALIGNDLSRCTSNDTETTDGWVVENRPHWPMRGGTPSYSLAAAGDV